MSRMNPSPVPASPEFLGFSVVTLTLVISLLSFVIAMVALVWQIIKHFLDGGRVKVSLNAAIWEPDFMLATNRSGRLLMKNGDAATAVVRGRALEVAQLVVENPGRIPVTVYSPGLSFNGHRQKQYSVVPRMFETDGAYGPDDALTDNIVRIEPYGRVTFLLDLWSIMPGILKDAPKGEVTVRGQVDVAGKKHPRKSAWRKRWNVRRGMYTAIEGEPDFTPYAVIWGVMFRQLPRHEDAKSNRNPNAGVAVSRGMVGYLLDGVMSSFDERPDEKRFEDAMNKAAENHGEKFPSFALATYQAYQELDRMHDHLTGWHEGLFRASHQNRNEQAGSAADVGAQDPT